MKKKPKRELYLYDVEIVRVVPGVYAKDYEEAKNIAKQIERRGKTHVDFTEAVSVFDSNQLVGIG